MCGYVFKLAARARACVIQAVIVTLVTLTLAYLLIPSLPASLSPVTTLTQVIITITILVGIHVLIYFHFNVISRKFVVNCFTVNVNMNKLRNS